MSAYQIFIENQFITKKIKQINPKTDTLGRKTHNFCMCHMKGVWSILDLNTSYETSGTSQVLVVICLTGRDNIACVVWWN